MAILQWDQVGERYFETGLDHGVLYPIGANNAYAKGVAWNGLTQVSESPSGAEATKLYADNIKYLNLLSAEDFGATITAYTYPVEWEVIDGSAELSTGVMIGQQPRKVFGLSYRTLIGNDVDGQNHGFKIHLIYGALASPSDKSRDTVNESPSAVEFSWTITTTPVPVPGHQPSAHIILDSRYVPETKMTKVLDCLYGTESTEPKLPTPAELIELLADPVGGG